jgi:hypothetical protein
VSSICLRFRDTVLSKGGSEDAMELFVAFRGRKPSIEPLLKHSGLTARLLHFFVIPSPAKNPARPFAKPA